jgi:hypothetical protein
MSDGFKLALNLKDTDFNIVVSKLGDNTKEGMAVVVRMIGTEWPEFNQENLTMMNILHGMGIYGRAFHLIYAYGCHSRSLRLREAFSKIIDSKINLIDLKVAIIKEDGEQLYDLFKVEANV